VGGAHVDTAPPREPFSAAIKTRLTRRATVVTTRSLSTPMRMSITQRSNPAPPPNPPNSPGPQ
jgi:hypothetical protein